MTKAKRKPDKVLRRRSFSKEDLEGRQRRRQILIPRLLEADGDDEVAARAAHARDDAVTEAGMTHPRALLEARKIGARL